MYTLILPQFEEFAHPDIRPGGALENLTYPYNLTEAMHILDEAGFIDIDGDGWRNFPEELGGDGSNIILKYFIRSDDPKRKALGLWHANQLESIGIKIEKVLGDIWTAVQEVMRDKNFSLYTGGWSVQAFPDYLVIWHSYYYWHPGFCYNYDRVNCSAYDYWVDKILEGLEAKRFEEVRYATLKAQEAFNSPDCLGAIPICAPIQYEVGDNNFSNNFIAYNQFSFKLVYSLNNSIYENNIKNNLYGILLHYASSNKIFHNNFINNTQQVHDYSWNYTWFSPSINIWDNGYPSGGNYWSNYTGVDYYRGSYQNETGSDGIGDTPYIIDENNVDPYPLMGSFGGSTVKGQNVTAYPSSNICLIFENITEDGLTTVNETDIGPEPPTGFKLAGKYYDIKTTANYSGIIKIRIAYNDANMTEEEEANLCLMQWNETLQQWIDITTYLDIENNVIYGETTHLSIFAILTPMLAPPTITATIEIEPDAANLISKGERIIVYIELPEGYDVDDIVVSSILLNDTISVDSAAPFVVGDYDEDSVPDLMVRFNGTILSEFILSAGIVYGNVTLTLTGKLINDVSFQGSDIILVSALVGDVNVDGKVDIIDLSIAALAFGSYPDHPRWNSQADIKNDGYVNMLDIALTARNFGTTYQP